MNHTKYDRQAQNDEVMFHEWQDEDKKMDLLDTLTCIGSVAGIVMVLTARYFGLI